MTADDGFDFGIQERIEDFVDLGAGYAEDILHALRFQTLDE